MLDTLICQAFYNPHIVTVLQQLVAGSDVEAVKSWDLKWRALGFLPVRDSFLYQIPVPPEFHGQTYGKLYEFLLMSRGILPLGLFRGIWKKMKSGPKGNKMPYVYTNPDKDASLETCDSVFVLAQDPPDDLLTAKAAFSDVVESLGKARRLSTALAITGSESSMRQADIGQGPGTGDVKLGSGEQLSSYIKACTDDVTKAFKAELSKLNQRIDELSAQQGS